MDRKPLKLFCSLGAGALALAALQTCDASGLFKCLCDRDRCQTPDCRDICRKPPECDCRFGHFTTEWTPWAANCPPSCAPHDNPLNAPPSYQHSGTPYTHDPYAVPITPEPVPSYVPEQPNAPLENGFDPTPYLPAPQPPSDISLPLPPDVQIPSGLPQPPQVQQPASPNSVLPQPALQVAPLPPVNAPQVPRGSTVTPNPIEVPKAVPMPPTLNDFQPPTKSSIPGDSAFRRFRNSVQPTSYWPQDAGQKAHPNSSIQWRIMPGYHGSQPQQPVMSQPFHP